MSLPFLRFGEIYFLYLRVRAIPTLESTDSMIIVRLGSNRNFTYYIQLILIARQCRALSNNTSSEVWGRGRWGGSVEHSIIVPCYISVAIGSITPVCKGGSKDPSLK